MENLPSSLMGYQKQAVDDLLTQKNIKLETQQQDINYLRSEITELKKSLKKQTSKKSNNNK